MEKVLFSRENYTKSFLFSSFFDELRTCAFIWIQKKINFFYFYSFNHDNLHEMRHHLMQWCWKNLRKLFQSQIFCFIFVFCLGRKFLPWCWLVENLMWNWKHFQFWMQITFLLLTLFLFYIGNIWNRSNMKPLSNYSCLN